jgi:nucleotide-binding universal stress UspA family protein
MFTHILVPTDGSQMSANTVARAVTFAKEIGARLTFYYAKPDYPIALYGEGALLDPTTPERFAEMADRQAEHILADAKQAADTLGVNCTLLSTVCNVPYKGIIEAATSAGCDLIFMASHGRRGLSSLLLGSETNRVLTHTTVPVLVYR